jgi:hypothetical protein
MSNSAHKYQNTVTLSPNTYKRTTRITYNTRKGKFSKEEEWIDGNIDNTIILKNDNSLSRETQLNHSFINWNYINN